LYEFINNIPVIIISSNKTPALSLLKDACYHCVKPKYNFTCLKTTQIKKGSGGKSNRYRNLWHLKRVQEENQIATETCGTRKNEKRKTRHIVLPKEKRKKKKRIDPFISHIQHPLYIC
jgi:hypothetical protein